MIAEGIVQEITEAEVEEASARIQAAMAPRKCKTRRSGMFQRKMLALQRQGAQEQGW